MLPKMKSVPLKTEKGGDYNVMTSSGVTIAPV